MDLQGGLGLLHSEGWAPLGVLEALLGHLDEGVPLGEPALLLLLLLSHCFPRLVPVLVVLHALHHRHHQQLLLPWRDGELHQGKEVGVAPLEQEVGVAPLEQEGGVAPLV